MKKITYYILMAFSLIAVSCSDSDDFSAGSPAGTTGKGVYFSSNYDAQYIVGHEPTIKDTLWFSVERKETGTALDVPIIVEKADDIIKIVDGVRFEKGDTIDSLGITYVGLQYKQESKFVLRIPDEYANPYIEKDGTTRLETSVFRSEWLNVCDTLFIASQADNWPQQGCMLQQLAGKNQFRITNFLGSGNDLEFNLSTGYDKANAANSHGPINPTSNYYDDGSEYWFYTNDGEYGDWSPSGSDMVIDYVEFYKGDNYTFIDMRCDPTTADTVSYDNKTYLCDYYNHYSMMAAWIVYLAPYASKKGWDYLYFYPCYLVEKKK